MAPGVDLSGKMKNPLGYGPTRVLYGERLVRVLSLREIKEIQEFKNSKL